MAKCSLIVPYDFKNIIIISGGQMGADTGGLEGAVKAGFETGGFLPKGCKTEKGPMPELKEKFHLIESSSDDYVHRTQLNVKSSSMTLWFGSNDSPGFHATHKSSKANNKPFYDVTGYSDDDIVKLIKEKKPSIINIAGNRESKAVGIQGRVRNTIYNVLNKLKGIKINE
jgi:hypothetical protein